MWKAECSGSGDGRHDEGKVVSRLETEDEFIDDRGRDGQALQQ
jgi:hypothetical protein